MAEDTVPVYVVFVMGGGLHMGDLLMETITRSLPLNRKTLNCREICKNIKIHPNIESNQVPEALQSHNFSINISHLFTQSLSKSVNLTIAVGLLF